MATRALWINELVPRFSGITVSEVDYEFDFTMAEFYRRSTAWREVIYDLDIITGTREVPIPVDNIAALEGGFKVEGILRAYYDSRQVTQYSHVPWETSSNMPVGFTGRPADPYILSLATVPETTITSKLDVWVYGRPADTSGELPDLVTNTFYEPVSHGIMGRLYGKPDKPWHDPVLSVYHLRKYRNLITESKDRANRGFTGNAQNWVFPSFGR